MTTDQFLARYYRASERRASPRAASIEAEVRSTYEQAEEAQSHYTWALCVLQAVKLDPIEDAVLRHYYLGLSNAHYAIIERRFSKQTKSVQAKPVPHHGSPPDAADLQSYCDWGLLCDQVGIFGRNRVRVAQRLWGEARDRVAEALEARTDEPR